MQLSIYALLYYEKHNKLPDRVGIDFLKWGRKFIPVNSRMIRFAKDECKLIKSNTRTTDVKDYPKQESKLCKWGEGKNKCCEYYALCNG